MQLPSAGVLKKLLYPISASGDIRFSHGAARSPVIATSPYAESTGGGFDRICQKMEYENVEEFADTVAGNIKCKVV